MNTPCLSAVVPVFNEVGVLPETHRRLSAALASIGEPFEVIYVDDGSTDGSTALLTELSARDPAVRVVALSRNFGHELATSAGLHHARGWAAIVLDADLQDPPEVIPEFVKHWRAGYQVVYGVRRRREGDSLLKRCTAFCFYRLLGRIADVQIPADTGDFRLLDRQVIDAFTRLGEEPRFFRGLISWLGFRQLGVLFDRQPRAGGVSKYRPAKLFRLAMDTLTAFSTFPGRIIFTLALAVLFASIFAGMIAFGGWLFGAWILPSWTWLAAAVIVILDVQFLCLGILAEYLVRTHRHTQGRPLYVVAAVIENGKPIVKTDQPSR